MRLFSLHELGTKTVRRGRAFQPVLTSYKLLEIERPDLRHFRLLRYWHRLAPRRDAELSRNVWCRKNSRYSKFSMPGSYHQPNQALLPYCFLVWSLPKQYAGCDTNSMLGTTAASSRTRQCHRLFSRTEFHQSPPLAPWQCRVAQRTCWLRRSAAVIASSPLGAASPRL